MSEKLLIKTTITTATVFHLFFILQWSVRFCWTLTAGQYRAVHCTVFLYFSQKQLNYWKCWCPCWLSPLTRPCERACGSLCLTLIVSTRSFRSIVHQSAKCTSVAVAARVFMTDYIVQPPYWQWHLSCPTAIMMSTLHELFLLRPSIIVLGAHARVSGAVKGSQGPMRW